MTVGRSGALVSAFAAGAGLVLGQRATAEKSNEKTAIPELLATLALEGCIVTIDAMGTQPNIAQAIRDRGADYILSVKDNQPKLADSVQDFFVAVSIGSGKHASSRLTKVVEKDHGRLEGAPLLCLRPDRLSACARALAGLEVVCSIASQRTIKGKTTLEHRLYISSLPADAQPGRSHQPPFARLLEAA